MRSRIEPIQKFARMLRNHRPLNLNWLRVRRPLSPGLIEGFNAQVKLSTRKSYGFRGQRSLQTALYHALAKLPEPESTQRFC